MTARTVPAPAVEAGRSARRAAWPLRLAQVVRAGGRHRPPPIGRWTWLGLGVLGGIVLFALIAPLGLPDPRTQDYSAVLAGNSAAHPLGTDHLGRDLLSRLASGARVSLIVAFGSQSVALAVGIAIGGAAAMRGGRVDGALMRLTDTAFAFPALLFLILVRTALGGGLWTLTASLALIGWPLYARLARAQFLTLIDAEFVVAARSVGASPGRILWRHLLPNARSALLVAWAFALPQAVFLEATLGFLGLSVAPPSPTWGTMIAQGYDVVFVRPAVVLYPVIGLALLSLAAMLVAEGLRSRDTTTSS